MGVDSLVAVEMRSWFLKELGVDVPVMKILGGASIASLVDDVLHKLPEELLKRLDPDWKSESQGDETGSTRVLNGHAGITTNVVANGHTESAPATNGHKGTANGTATDAIQDTANDSTVGSTERDVDNSKSKNGDTVDVGNGMVKGTSNGFIRGTANDLSNGTSVLGNGSDWERES